MRTLAPGSSVLRPIQAARRASLGFTLLEILIVMTIIAIAAGGISLALRDPTTTRLEREAVRLAAVLESARAEARAAGLAVQWVPATQGPGNTAQAFRGDFRFIGLPSSVVMPQQWLTPGVQATIRTRGGLANTVLLGPEPLIPAQHITLSLSDQSVSISTDGLQPFELRSAR